MQSWVWDASSLEYTSTEKRTLNTQAYALLYLALSPAYYCFDPYLQFANQDTFYDKITFYLLFRILALTGTCCFSVNVQPKRFELMSSLQTNAAI